MSTSLDGRKILITREENQAKEFTERVIQYGGTPIETPLLKISCIDHDESRHYFRNINKYSWIFFTSANGVKCFFQLADKYKVDIELFQHIHLAAVGHKTENYLKKIGLIADFIPSIYNADVMADEFLKKYKETDSILLVRGNRSRDVLPVELSKQELTFDSIEVYETSYNYEIAESLNNILLQNTLDFITFTSPSTVEAFVEMANVNIDTICVCIGTTTENRARELGFTSIITAKEFTIEGMLACILQYVSSERIDYHDKKH
ncbi:uroporphyrinogen-III synthase [Virgibacillus profundi]|uniref:Uroporphyrinogen-III synthase n=1 Tax=Virgibacillus profundi TaxID=2024555 RepID=A0A2A2I8I8_9BACI|nr:uroporphyrinogen-III synthase [Virgibacillus profundi]PAV27698.1 uroporphyrinogen-III synthase [Virgibacillus profundi]PXY51853.1 uroporphyrinogen-III synthase [Virgibacillus profundi]